MLLMAFPPLSHPRAVVAPFYSTKDARHPWPPHTRATTPCTRAGRCQALRSALFAPCPASRPSFLSSLRSCLSPERTPLQRSPHQHGTTDGITNRGLSLCLPLFFPSMSNESVSTQTGDSDALSPEGRSRFARSTNPKPVRLQDEMRLLVAMNKRKAGQTAEGLQNVYGAAVLPFPTCVESSSVDRLCRVAAQTERCKEGSATPGR
ncbi:unnamed protein product [Vitrella brassicaformis CCMP3155]|uniref:Uncharacterized protein n=1 Tax=Vitrella brassicaformis (strain CCMP3155) TaxID=1169540 RepID=A0A0G4FR82_VITBC|nr:unnamed protein product [Vitrella brassicaformis CCMP3155]|eukprot:CEM16746.1 unnamed protein product [Vitrella brassicaformis CCMP3155]